MQMCSFCGIRYKDLKNICDNTLLPDGKAAIIEDLLKIFRTELVQKFFFNINCFICPECIRQLENSYKFVHQIKDEALKLKQNGILIQEPDQPKVLSDPPKPNSLENNDSKARAPKYILPKLPNHPPSTSQTEALHPPNSVSRLYKCLECSRAFKSYKKLREHEADNCNKKTSACGVFVCKFCHLCFQKNSSLAEHQLTLHGQQQFICCLCNDKEFSSRGYLSRHISKIHEHKCLKYFCGECQDLFVLDDEESISSHFNELHTLMTNNDKQQDNQTDTFNDDDMDLEMHEEFLDEFLLAHTNENSFQFSECWEALDLHLPDMLQNNGTHFNNREEFSEAFPCPKCFEQFKQPQPLLRHLAESHNLAVLICCNCRKAFSNYKDFKSHKADRCMKSASFDPLHIPCPYCNRTFGSSSNLKQHLRIVHTRYKRHICQLCDKQFSTLDHLKKHVLSQHQNERKNVCPICTKAFTQHCHMKQHLAIHTTGKTLQCSKCPKKFWRKVDMQRHQIKRHAET